MMVVVLLSGCSAIVTLNSALGVEIAKMTSMLIMLIPAVVGAISVVWNLTDRARDHEMLARRFYEIAASIDPERANEQKIQRWRNEILGVYEDEPAVYHALNAECYNAATRALGYGEDKLRQIAWWRHLLRNWWMFSAKDFPATGPTKAQPS